MPAVPPLAILVLLSLAALPGRAGAQAPACDVQTAGLVACVAGKLCDCRFERASAATGLPDGFRWDCGVLRPRCGEPVPATSDPYLGPLPEALSIEREINNITAITGDRNRTHIGNGGRPRKP